MIFIGSVMLGCWVCGLRGIGRVTAATIAIAVLWAEQFFASSLSVEEGLSLAPTVFRTGTDIYLIGWLPVSPVSVAAVATIGVLLAKNLSQATRSAAVLLAVATCLAAGLGGVIAGDGISQIWSRMSPWVFVLCGVLVGRELVTVRSHRGVVRVLGAVLVAKAVMALAVATGMLQGSGGFTLFYDSATPFVAAATALGLVTTQSWNRHIATVVSAFAIVAASPRRAPAAAALLALGLIVVVNRSRARIMVPILVAIAAGLILPALIPTTIGDRVVDAVESVLAGDNADASTAGHLSDLSIGLGHALESPWVGLGTDAPQPVDLAAYRARSFYVHNEFLQAWVVSGPLCAALVVAMTLMLVSYAVKSQRRSERRLLEAIAAVAAFMFPLCLMFFPYLSATVRWPILFGIAMGILGFAREEAADRDPQSLTSDQGRRR